MEKIKHELDLLPMVLRTKARKTTGKAPLTIRITLKDQKPKEVPVGTTILPENWDVESKTVSKSESNHRAINNKIKGMLVDLNRIYDKLFFEHNIITPEMIKRVYFNKPIVEESIIEDPTLPPTLLEVFDEFIEKFQKMVEKDDRSPFTKTQLKTTKKKLQTFLQVKYKKDDIDFKEISPEFGDEIFDFLTLDVPKPLSEGTAKKHIKKIKQIIKIGVKKRIILTNPIEDFVCGGDQKEIPPLEYDQVLKIFYKDFGIDRLNEVRDAFIFQTFTGFAFQDIYNLTSENIILVGQNKERWLAKHRGKTDVYEIVPMLPLVEQLIDRYKDHPKCVLKGVLMPVNSNTRYNGYLKEIAEICNINRKLTTHLARHTFADIMLNLGMPMEDVGKMLGHRSIRTTQRYCRVSIRRLQKNFNEFIRPVLSMNTTMKILTANPQDSNDSQILKSKVVPFSTFCSTGTVNFSYSIAK
ncbi:site-specific integrase [Sphingobacterium sp. UBA5670]|uniref:site-specific integrase n=1 Tax=Sphingobacterium sp. UBA5670 TaxID=1947502 RepID=UPI0025F810B7|nr:site-specific integrase [Sphingobacterium sp. UBA5670]